MYVDFIGNVNSSGGFTANGDIDIGGQYLQNGTCVVGCAINGRPARAVRRYVPTVSMPTVEDFGEARLVNGQAHVALGADFANVVDRYAAYLVFITPEGDSNGVYVVNKTSSGFDVRENCDGHSTLSFQYRIVAKPYGERGTRLPLVLVGRSAQTRPGEL